MNSLLEGIFFQEGGGNPVVRSGVVPPGDAVKSPEELEQERLAQEPKNGGRRRSRRRRGRGRGRGKRTRGRRH